MISSLPRQRSGKSRGFGEGQAFKILMCRLPDDQVNSAKRLVGLQGISGTSAGSSDRDAASPSSARMNPRMSAIMGLFPDCVGVLRVPDPVVARRGLKPWRDPESPARRRPSDRRPGSVSPTSSPGVFANAQDTEGFASRGRGRGPLLVFHGRVCRPAFYRTLTRTRCARPAPALQRAAVHPLHVERTGA
jgi:hypothetical protein